jgi:DNA-binding response OmpR family regulator
MPRVLVVDGYDASRDASVRELRLAGFDVLGVEEEEEALRMLGEQPADIVLLDLPPSEAGEAANAIRAASATHGRAISVIAIVDPSTSREMRNEGRASGIDYFILRPCPPAEIVKHLRRMRR